MNKQRSLALLALTAATAFSASAHAQSSAWPTKPVQIVMAGNDDTEITLYKEKLAQTFGKPFILDHIFYNNHLRCTSHRVCPTPASDHHALVANFEFVKP